MDPRGIFKKSVNWLDSMVGFTNPDGTGVFMVLDESNGCGLTLPYLLLNRGVFSFNGSFQRTMAENARS
jgi:hypothetical protein